MSTTDFWECLLFFKKFDIRVVPTVYLRPKIVLWMKKNNTVRLSMIQLGVL